MKNKIILLIIAIILVRPITAFALDGEINVTCNKTEVKKGDKISCEISGNSDGEVSAVHGIISASDNLEVKEIVKDASWEGTSNYSTVDYYTSQNKTKDFKIVKVELVAKEDGDATLSFDNAYLVDKNFDKNNVSNANVKLKVVSTSNDETKPDNPLNSSPGTGFVMPVVMLVILTGGVVVAKVISRKKQPIHKI